MDTGIYAPAANEIGTYATRRFPKGKGTGAGSGGTDAGGGTALDANPRGVTLRYGQASVAPHAVAQRDLYVVPPRRRAKIENMQALIQRDTAAGAAGEFGLQIRMYRNGSLTPIELAVLDSFINAAFTNAQTLNEAAAIEMFEGDSVEIITFDNSTGGNVQYSGVVVIVEYDSVVHVVQALDSPYGNTGALGGVTPGSSPPTGSAQYTMLSPYVGAGGQYLSYPALTARNNTP